jgi:hypothetical protein
VLSRSVNHFFSRSASRVRVVALVPPSSPQTRDDRRGSTRKQRLRENCFAQSARLCPREWRHVHPYIENFCAISPAMCVRKSKKSSPKRWTGIRMSVAQCSDSAHNIDGIPAGPQFQTLRRNFEDSDSLQFQR